MNEYFFKLKVLGENVKVELALSIALSNCATKGDLKKQQVLIHRNLLKSWFSYLKIRN